MLHIASGRMDVPAKRMPKKDNGAFTLQIPPLTEAERTEIRTQLSRKLQARPGSGSGHF
jgi:hypothetical protein